MKKGLLVLLAVASFVACKRDYDNNDASLVGVWKEEKTVTYSGKDNSVLETEIPSDCKKKESLEFTKDGKYIFKSFAIIDEVCKESSSEEGTYTYNASTKIIKSKTGNKEREVKVNSVTSNELQGIEDDKDVNQDGSNDKVITYFKRQR